MPIIATCDICGEKLLKTEIVGCLDFENDAAGVWCGQCKDKMKKVYQDVRAKYKKIIREEVARIIKEEMGVETTKGASEISVQERE